MRIVEIDQLPNGAHRNQSGADICPDGWAVVPDGMILPNFPFGTPTVEDGIVVAWDQGVVPEPEPEPVPEPVDMAQRITELEDAIIELAAIIGGDG